MKLVKLSKRRVPTQFDVWILCILTKTQCVFVYIFIEITRKTYFFYFQWWNIYKLWLVIFTNQWMIFFKYYFYIVVAWAKGAASAGPLGATHLSSSGRTPTLQVYLGLPLKCYISWYNSGLQKTYLYFIKIYVLRQILFLTFYMSMWFSYIN